MKNIDDEELQNKEVDSGIYEADIIKLYLRNISTKLLTREEEIDLAIRVKNGDKLARNELIECNLRFVYWVAKKYRGLGFTFMDMIQEGNIGLIRAVDTFDYTKKVRFSTHALYYIKNYILRALENKSRAIKIPTYLYWRIYKYRNVYNELEVKLNRKPNLAELASNLGMTIAEVKQLQIFNQDVISFNSNINNDSELTLEDFISSENLSVEDEVLDKICIEEILEKIDEYDFNKKEKEILILHYGLDGQSPKNLKEIQRYLNVSYECIRQNKRKALLKIKSLKIL